MTNTPAIDAVSAIIKSLSCEDQLAIAKAVAGNIGYDLIGEGEPDEPRHIADIMGRPIDAQMADMIPTMYSSEQLDHLKDMRFDIHGGKPDPTDLAALAKVISNPDIVIEPKFTISRENNKPSFPAEGIGPTHVFRFPKFKTGDEVVDIEPRLTPAKTFTIVAVMEKGHDGTMLEFAERPGELFKASRFKHKPGSLVANILGEPKPNHQPPSVNTITRKDVEYFKMFKQDSFGLNSLDQYQTIATKSAIYPGKGTPLGLNYVALKLNGEAGELAEHVGKAMRDDDLIVVRPRPGFLDGDEVQFNELTPERRAAIIKEIGDNLWYLSAECNELGITLSDAALANLEKLCDRSERGTLQGSGDTR